MAPPSAASTSATTKIRIHEFRRLRAISRKKVVGAGFAVIALPAIGGESVRGLRWFGRRLSGRCSRRRGRGWLVAQVHGRNRGIGLLDLEVVARPEAEHAG